MTVGDKGSDAYYLQKMGFRHITATNIDDSQLNYLKETGILSGIAVKAINAERIDLADNSVDFVLCKESFHHFPRPPIAFYEMLRVCREAVILIEPKDSIRLKLLDGAKVIIKTILRRKRVVEHLFEHCGNYLFRLSEHEVKKMMIALQKDYIAVKYSNSFYLSSIAHRTTAHLIPFFIQRLGVFTQDVFCKLGLLNYGLITMIVFKTGVPIDLKESLSKHGFKVISLPKNPYLNKGSLSETA